MPASIWLDALVLSAIYVLMASGLVLVFSIMGIFNFAHGQFYMMGAYVMYCVFEKAGCNFFAGLLAAAVARALMAGPRLLMLDEPSLGLSPLLVKQLARRLRQISEEGTPLVLVEQNARMALGLAQYGYVMENGELSLEGRSEELLKDKRVIKAFLGT